MILKFIYTLFIGILLALFVGFGIAAFYEEPKYPEPPASLKYTQPIYPESKDSSFAAKITLDQIKQEKLEKEFQKNIQIYNRNVGIIKWIKIHKLSSFLLAVILIFIWNFLFSFIAVDTLRTTGYDNSINSGSSNYNSLRRSYSGGAGVGAIGEANIAPMPPVSTQVSGGMMMRSSTLSLLVNDVKKSADYVKDQAEKLGGFMIQSDFSNPGEAPNATITVRVPASNLNTYLSSLRSQAIRVTSENLEGYDITDQYTDTQKRLVTLNKTKEKFEAIYAKATAVQDILDVQNRLIENQNQIDQLKGQVQYMEKSVQLAKVTVYLSTDELALPYDSDSSWRPVLVFKQAIRSLVATLHNIFNFVIWVLVYAVIWLPLYIIIYFIRRYRRRKLNEDTLHSRK